MLSCFPALAGGNRKNHISPKGYYRTTVSFTLMNFFTVSSHKLLSYRKLDDLSYLLLIYVVVRI